MTLIQRSFLLLPRSIADEQVELSFALSFTFKNGLCDKCSENEVRGKTDSYFRQHAIQLPATMEQYLCFKLTKVIIYHVCITESPRISYLCLSII